MLFDPDCDVVIKFYSKEKLTKEGKDKNRDGKIDSISIFLGSVSIKT